MIRIMLVAMLLLIAGCGAPVQNNSDDYISQILRLYPELTGKAYTVDTVKRIVDGDTFQLEDGSRVRLIGVNTPEITNGKSEYYGQEAKQFTSDQLLGREVVLFSDVGDTDRYGRLLRYVFVEPETQMFNERLVAEGYANTMTVAPNVTYAERFVSLEREAREEGRGLWGIEEGAQSDADAGGAAATDADAIAPDSANEPLNPANCDDPQIKGNINSRGDRIYHVPGSRYYDATIAEKMFCTIEEAEADGFRAPKNS
jgi:micrococcal nuclease